MISGRRTPDGDATHELKRRNSGKQAAKTSNILVKNLSREGRFPGICAKEQTRTFSLFSHGKSVEEVPDAAGSSIPADGFMKVKAASSSPRRYFGFSLDKQGFVSAGKKESL